MCPFPPWLCEPQPAVRCHRNSNEPACEAEALFMAVSKALGGTNRHFSDWCLVPGKGDNAVGELAEGTCVVNSAPTLQLSTC